MKVIITGGTGLIGQALAADLARLCLEEAGVVKVRVRVEKPGAVRFSKSVGVEIERSKEDPC